MIEKEKKEMKIKEFCKEYSNRIDKLKASDVFDKGLPAEYLVGLYSIIEE